LKQRHVSFTRTVQEHVAKEKAWWLENRDHGEIFAEELEQALKVIAILPGAGTLYQRSPVPGAFFWRERRGYGLWAPMTMDRQGDRINRY
jgi:hypothetical protein